MTPPGPLDGVGTVAAPAHGAAARTLGLLQIRPHDTSTADGRSAERYRRIAWSTVLGAAARAVGIAVSLITVPLVIGYLGNERYGMWLTISSVISILGPLDLGIGFGLLTVVADAHGRDDRLAARRAISTALLMLSVIATAAAVVVALIGRFVPWAAIFNVTSPLAAQEASVTAYVVIGLFIVGFPLGVVGIVRNAYQSGFVTSIFAIAASVLSLAFLLIAQQLQAGLPVLVLALSSAGIFAAILNGVLLFAWQRPWLRPRVRDFGAATAKRLLRIGGLFVVLQIAGVAAYQIDNLVIAQIMGAAAVPQYAVPLKLFTLAPTIVSFALMPLWPAYGEALARGDAGWVVLTLRRSIRLALAINVPASIALVLFGPAILNAWVGTAVAPTALLLVGLGIWSAMNGVVGPIAMLLNGANVIGFQAACAVLMAIGNVIVSVLLVQRIGVAGAVYGSIIAQLLFVLLPCAWYVPRVIARIRADAAAKARP